MLRRGQQLRVCSDGRIIVCTIINHPTNIMITSYCIPYSSIAHSTAHPTEICASHSTAHSTAAHCT